MTAYSTIARTTADQLAAKGASVTVTYRTAGVYNTATGAATISTSTAIAKGVILPFSEGLRKMAGTNIALADQQLLLAALATNGTALVAPKVDDTVTANGKVYSVVDVAPLAPDGTNLLFTCQVRAAGAVPVAVVVVTTLDPTKKGPSLVLSNGNLTVVKPVGGSWETVFGTVSKAIANTTGYYFEATAVLVASFARVGFGVAAANLTGVYEIGSDANSQGQASDGMPFATGDILGFYLRNSQYWWRKNGTWNGDPAAGTGGIAVTIGANVFPAFGALPTNGQWDVNFGASAFAGAIPAGGVSWNTA